MSKSQFWQDGYQDAKAGFECSPPDSRTRDDGETTDVYVQEYCEGYHAGFDYEANLPAPAGTNDANFDQFYC